MLLLCCVCARAGLTHAVFHHHEAALITFKALALEVSGRVDTPARPADVQGDAALVDVCSKEMQHKKKKADHKHFEHLKQTINRLL